MNNEIVTDPKNNGWLKLTPTNVEPLKKLGYEVMQDKEGFFWYKPKSDKIQESIVRNVLLEQSSCVDGGWAKTAQRNVNALKATGKYDIKQCEGGWYYKLKSSTPTPTSTGTPTPTPTPTPTANPNPIPDLSDIERIFWEKVKDAELLDKLKAAGKKVWQEGGVWYRDIRDRLSNWWEDMTTLPDWAEKQPCLSDVGGVDRSDSDDKVQVRTQDGEDYLYFYKDGKFVYENKVKAILNGTWKCVSGKLYIKTDDGYEFTKKDGWVKQGTSSLGSSSSSSTNSGKIYTTPGDPYQYRLSNECEWETKGKSITDWKSLKNIPAAIKELDIRFPEAKKECGQSTNTSTNTSTTTEPTRPSWTNEYLCLKGFVDMIPTTQTNKISFKSTSGKDSLNFYKNLKFIYEYENGSISNGTWKCENDEIVIDTEDGSRYTSSKGWTKVTQVKPDEFNPNISDDSEL